MTTSILRFCAGTFAGAVTLGALAACKQNHDWAPTGGDSVRATAMGGATFDPDKRYAVIVAIAHYPQPAYELPSPAQDAAALRSVLIDRFGYDPSKVHTLLDAHATRDSVVWAFRRFLSQAGPQGSAAFFFVGHGLPLDSNYSVQDPEPTGHDQALYVWGQDGHGAIILDDELNLLIRELPTPRTLIVLDGCYSGSGVTFTLLSRRQGTDVGPKARVMSVDFISKGNPADFPNAFLSDGGSVVPNAAMDMAFISATDDRGRAYSMDRWPTNTQARSIFNYFFVRALGTSPGSASFDQVTELVKQAALADPLCKAQHYCQTALVHGKGGGRSLADILGPPL